MRLLCAAALMVYSTYGFSDVKLTLNVAGIKKLQGSLYVAVYNQETGWLKDEGSVRQEIIPITQNRQTLQFDLPPGQYAVQAFQDVNGNGKLDMRWLPPGPSEPWGVSNNRTDRIGPPRYSDAVFSLAQPLEVDLTLVPMDD